MTQDAQSSPKLPRLGTNIGLATASLLAALATAEATLRIFNYNYSPLAIDAANRFDERNYHAFRDNDFVFDTDLIWIPRKNHGVFNALGFRGPELGPDKPPGERRVIAIGDSNTLGWSGTEGPNWPGDLESVARQRGLGVRVVNAGVWGYSSYQGIGRLRQCLSLSPDLVLISFGGNDAHPATLSDGEYAERQSGEHLWMRQFARWRLGQLIVAAHDRLLTLAQGRSSSHRVDLEDYRRNLRTMITLVRGQGARVALLTRPYVGESHPQSWKNLAPDYNAATADVAADEKVSLVDVYTAFRDRREYFTDESHFTREGHRLAAERIFSEIAPLLY